MYKSSDIVLAYDEVEQLIIESFPYSMLQKKLEKRGKFSFKIIQKPMDKNLEFTEFTQKIYKSITRLLFINGDLLPRTIRLYVSSLLLQAQDYSTFFDFISFIGDKVELDYRELEVTDNILDIRLIEELIFKAVLEYYKQNKGRF